MPDRFHLILDSELGQIDLLAEQIDAFVARHALSPEVAGDIQLAVNRYGWEGFESEWLFPAGQTQLPPPGWRPYYEIHGEHQVESGVYDRVLRYKEQFRPAAYALRAAAEREA